MNNNITVLNLIHHLIVSLYLTLLNDLEKKYITDVFTHHHLLSVLQMSLNDIKISREKLEGVGLLKTYLKKDNINNYVYVLYNPISANEFLNHPILNVVLYTLSASINDTSKLFISFVISIPIVLLCVGFFISLSTIFIYVFICPRYSFLSSVIFNSTTQYLLSLMLNNKMSI